MASLSGCIAKIGSVTPADAEAIYARAGALHTEGKSLAVAALQAVDEQIAAVRALLPVKEAAPEVSQAPAQAEPVKAEAPAAKPEAKAAEPPREDDAGNVALYEPAPDAYTSDNEPDAGTVGEPQGGDGAPGSAAPAPGRPARAGTAADDAVRRDGGTLPRGRITGLGIAADIERAGSAALVGRQAATADDLAELAQVYRDPRYETFRVFLTKGDAIVHATGLSSRLPGQAPMMPAGMTEPQYIQWFKDEMARTGADGYYILHNHPSGNPTPSSADMRMTASLFVAVPGMRAHVVINSGKYAVIDPGKDVRIEYKDFGPDLLLRASKPSALIGRAIEKPDDLVVMGKSLQRPGWVTLIGVDTGNSVRVVAEAPAAILGRGDMLLAATLRRTMRQSGARYLSLVGSDADVASAPVQRALREGLLRDAVGESGRTMAARGAAAGAPREAFAATGGRFVAEQEPSTRASAQAELASLFGDSANDVVTVAATYDDLPPRIAKAMRDNNARGMTLDGKRIFIVADQVAKGDVRGLVMHELGVHYAMSDADVKRLTEQVVKWSQGTGTLAEQAQWALRAAESSTSTNQEQETLAYMVQALTDAGVTPANAPLSVQTFLHRIKQALRAALKALGLNLTMTPQDVVDFAYGAAKMALTRGPAAQRQGADFQSAWHGSPHRFDKFDTSAIGTGEGAQAYGYGLYFTSKREIADYYRKKLSGGDMRPFEKGGKTISAAIDLAEAYFKPGRIVRGYGGADKVLEFNRTTQYGWSVKVVGVKANGDAMQHEPPRRHSTFPDAPTLKAVLEEDGWAAKEGGQLYEVEIPDDTEMLLWDKPLSEQPAKVRAALEGAEQPIISYWVGKSAENPAYDGHDLYLRLTGSERVTPLQWKGGPGFVQHNREAPKRASDKLRSLGIAGIKYLDGASRSAGDGSYNYVVFSGADAQILSTQFSRTSTKPRGVAMDDAQAVIAAIRQGKPKAPQITALEDVSKSPDALLAKIRAAGAENDVEGAYHEGVIYVYPQHWASIERGIFVTAHHEIRHHGLHSMMNDKELSSTLLSMYLGNKALRRAADKMVTDGHATSKVLATEESLADMPVAEMQALTGWDKIVAAVRRWLRKVAARLGLRGPREWTDNDVAALVQRAEDVTRGGGSGTALSRGNNAPELPGVDAAQPPRKPPTQAAIDTGPPQREPSGWVMPEGTKFDDFKYKYQDKHVDLKRAIAAIVGEQGQMADKWDAYLQEELFHERAAKRTQDFNNHELTPLMKDMALKQLTMAQLDEYLHARHAKEANILAGERNPDIPAMRERGSGMSDAEADAYMAGLDPAVKRRLEAVAARVDAILAKTRDLYASYGLESRETVDGWARMFEHYVPLHREDKDGGMGIGQGFSIKGKETKHRTGSTAKVVDILANIALQREKAIVRGEKNRVAVAVAGLVATNPNPDVWTFGPVPERRLNEQTGLVEARIGGAWKSADNVLVAKIVAADGSVQERGIVFNEHNERAVRMAQALKNLDAAHLEGALAISAKITRYFSAINTQYNPVFGTVNLVRDVGAAAINLTSTELAGHRLEVLGYTLSALSGVYRDARAVRKDKAPPSKWAELWEEFQNEGGATGFRDLYRTSEDRANALKAVLDPTAWTQTGWGKFFTAGGVLKVPLTVAQKGATPLFDWLSDYNQAMENATRLAAYKVALEQGMSKQRAASLAKNLTVNFNRKGQAGMQAGALYAFFNASMQGTARMAEVLFEMKAGDLKTLRMSRAGMAITAGGLLLGVTQAVLLAAAGFDDDEPPQFVRERNLIIPTGWTGIGPKKAYFTIPMPLGWHALPNMGRIATELALRKGKDAGKSATQMASVIFEAFNPIGSAGFSWQTVAPTPLDPMVALLENKDWTGKPIARKSFDATTPGHARARDTAPLPAIWLSHAINSVSGGTEFVAGSMSPTPDQIDFLWGQATGGVGRELSKAQQTVRAFLTGENLPPHKMPLVGRFYGNAEAASSQASRFYENLRRLDVHEAQLKGLAGADRDAEFDAYEKANPESVEIKTANRAARFIAKLRKEKSALLKANAPRAKVEAIEKEMADEMRRFNTIIEQANKPQKKAA